MKSSIPCLVSTYPLALKILASISPFVRRVASRLKLEGVLKGNSTDQNADAIPLDAHVC